MYNVSYATHHSKMQARQTKIFSVMQLLRHDALSASELVDVGVDARLAEQDWYFLGVEMQSRWLLMAPGNCWADSRPV